MTELQKQISDAIERNGDLTIGQLSKLLGIRESTVREELKGLKDNGYVSTRKTFEVKLAPQK